MKKTLLAMTQDILSEMDSDEINGTDDTVEAQQVVNIIKTCYYELISNRNWPHLKKLIQLDALGDTSKPNYLKAPDAMKELITFAYDKRSVLDPRPQMQDVTYKYPEDFLRYVAARDSSQTNVKQVVDFSGSTLLILKDQAPQFWTSFDDTYIVCDAYDSAVEATLQKIRTQCLAYMDPVWVTSDTFIPDLPAEAFSLLEEEAKSTAFLTLKQMANPKAEQKSARQNRWLARKAWRVAGGIQYEDYGRKARR